MHQGPVESVRVLASILAVSLWFAVAPIGARAGDGNDDATTGRVEEFIAAVRSGATAEVQRRRAALLTAEADEVAALGRVLREQNHRGVQQEVSDLLADMRSDVADDALRSGLVVCSQVRWPVAAAIVRRGAWIELDEEERDVLRAEAPQTTALRATTLVSLFLRDRAAADGGVSDAVEIVYTRARRAEAGERALDPSVALGPTAVVVRSAALELRKRAEVAIVVARRAEDRRAEDPTWHTTGRLFGLLFRSLLGDRSTASDVIDVAGDAAQALDARLLAVEAIPQAAGEVGRAALERLVSAHASERRSTPKYSHQARKPEELLARAAARSLRLLDANRDDE